MACFERALELQPGYTEARWNVSLNALRMGDYELGWREYEVRWDRKEAASHPKFSLPLWLGEEDIAGKTLLLHGEQGIGDTIQFLRYVPHACALGARVLLGLQQRAESLHSCFSSPAEVIWNGKPVPRHDVQAPLGSMPLALSRWGLQGIPADVPYLHVAPERLAALAARLQEAGSSGRRPRIGIAWSGDPTHPNDRNRSIRFGRLAPVLAAVDADFVVVQKPVRDADKDEVAASGAIDMSARLGDLHDTAALISLMDVVVSVDTSLAHLAGALARDVLILLPFSPDWRWLVEREDCPWYPTARLIRQPAPMAWDPVMARVASLLRQRFG
jgi:hypothetical protein